MAVRQAEVGDRLTRLVALAEAGDDRAVRGALLSWSPSELVLASSLGRRRYRHGAIDPIDGGGDGAAWLLALSWNGRCREVSAVRLSADPSPVADRMLALLLSDHVEQVRRRAWRAVEHRLDPARAAQSLPVLVALGGRTRGAAALRRYRDLIGERLGTEAWRLVWLSGDVATRRWAAGEWLGSGPPLASVLERLATEREPAVAGVLTRYVVARAGEADAAPLLRSPHARVRATGVWLSGDRETMIPLLVDRSPLVRAAARFRLNELGFDVRGWCQGTWERQGTVRALRAAVEAGAPIAPARLLDLAESGDPALGPTAIRALATPDLTPAESARLIGLLDRPGCVAAVVTTLRARGGWRFDELVPRWSDPSQRRWLAPLLASRGGWDRIRAALLAASDGDPGLVASARTWVASIGTAASTTLIEPDAAQRAHLLDLLAAGGIDPDIARPVEQRLGLPLTPYPAAPGPMPWGGPDAAVLLALAGTGRLLRPSLAAPVVLRSVGFTLGERLPDDAFDDVVERLCHEGLVVPPGWNEYALTAEGRVLVRGLRAHMPGAMSTLLARLADRGQPRF